MCGIAGLVDPDRPDGAELARIAGAMGRAVAHRGPDGEGIWVDAAAGVGLAHRRLAILGLGPGGAQPMVSADARWVIVYNGEVYNFAELRRHPALDGVSWRGHSDTEVILESVAHRGLAATLADLNGMFALALWDRVERRLHLVRDRLGIKPLYVAVRGRAVLFGSELGALRASGRDFAIEPAALASYLRLGYVPAPFSIHAGVEKLMPGEVLSVDAAGNVARRRYWSLDATAAAGVAAPLEVADAAAEARLHDLLLDAVRLQMVAEVPLGVFLSGGIDSSTIAALMCASGQGAVRSFSIGFPDAGFDESSHARAVAQHLGTAHTELTVTAREALAVVPGLADVFDEPFADSSQIPTFLVSQLTRGHVTVALSGDGGDELFAGYNRHLFAARWAPALARAPSSLRRALAALIRGLPAGAMETLATRAKGAPTQLANKLAKLARVLALDDDALYRALVSQAVEPSLHLAADEAAPVRLPAEAWPLLDRMRLADGQGYLPDDILTKVDRASMAVALEARPPLLDHRVVEFAWRLPSRFLVRSGTSKWLLRRVLQRYVPDALVARPKMGFAVPLAAWLRGPLREWAGDTLLASDYGGGLLRPGPARAAFEAHIAGSDRHTSELWTLLMFELWRRRHDGARIGGTSPAVVH
ncbi:MAG: asparagine synthase (glutamine-hydrolyzing) [Geminicoccaceae bacterium]|nr:MAG: asparagine synthase (glutamine-hydrolyzing) [Geminicoccaceae bacterium]